MFLCRMHVPLLDACPFVGCMLPIINGRGSNIAALWESNLLGNGSLLPYIVYNIDTMLLEILSLLLTVPTNAARLTKA